VISVRNIGRYTLLLPILVAMPLGAEEAIKMEGMSVIGNKESPNLLYIVPWKSPEIPDIDEPDISSRLFTEALRPVEREVLIRCELFREARQKMYNKQEK